MGKASFFFNVLFLLSAMVLAADDAPVAVLIKNPNQFEVRRSLQALSLKSGLEQGQAWAALVALERLTGHLNEAQHLVESCEGDCLKRVPLEEKKAIRTWICPKKPDFKICK